MPALALLAAAAVLGAAALRRLRFGLRGLELPLGGVLVGTMAVTWACYLLARAQGGVRPGTLAVLAALAVPAAVFVGLREARGIPWAAVARRDASLLALLAVAAAVLAPLYWTRMLLPRGGAIWSGGNAWGDMALHAALTASFAFADNVPPANPLFPPGPLHYPFLPDFLTALPMASGLSMHAALVGTAVPLALAVVGLFFALARRIAGSDRGALIASALLFLNGGLGFLYFLEEWRRAGVPLLAALATLREDYCHVDDLGLFWSNLVADVMLPQRAALFGLAATFLVVLAFSRAFGTDEDEPALRRVLLVAGVVTGALPRFHAHTYLALGFVSGLLFLLRPSRRWAWFWVPAVVLGAPQLLQVGGHASSFVWLKPGWRANGEPQLLFWTRNVGVVLLLAPAAWHALPRRWRELYLPFVVLQVLASVVMAQPSDWDNTKFMYVWYALTCVVVGAWVAAFSTRHPWLAAALVAGATASGLLALQHERTSRHVMFDADQVAVAEWVKGNTGGDDVFAAAPHHLQPVASLGGRRLVVGYPGWMWTHGYDYQPRYDDLVELYAGRRVPEVLERHDVRWIYLGPHERRELHARDDLLLATFPVVFRAGEILVLDARPRAGVSPPGPAG